MTKGKLAAITCPILEDELVYSLSNDDEVSEIIVMDNIHAKTIKEKLTEHGLDYVLCPEDDFFSGNVDFVEDGFDVVVWMMDLGLHEEPDDLRDCVRDSMKRIQDKVDAIVLYYGLCGNGLKDIEQWGKENLSIPVTIMKDRDGCVCDDCIAVAIGGTKKYLQLLRKYPGIFYFTPAYATNWDDMKHRMNLFKGVDMEDDTLFKMILDMAGYKYVMEIPTGLGDEKEFHRCVRKFADESGLDVMCLDKEWCTLEPAELTYRNAKSLL